MFDNIKKELYFFRYQLLFDKGLKDGRIVPFDESFYKAMSNTFLNSVPISIHIKYLKPSSPPGQCYERSLYMFYCFNDALLVRGNNKNLELRYGNGNGGHGWIEIGDYVYDPTLLKRFDKDLYYQIYCPTHVCKYSKEDYVKLNGSSYYDFIRSTKIEDYQIGGSRRDELGIGITQLLGFASLSDDENLKKEVNEYLSLIQYDEYINSYKFVGGMFHENFVGKFKSK